MSFDLLADIQELKARVNNLPLLTNRRLFPTLAIVLKNIDPEERRRIKVADPLFGGQVESDWINPIKVSQNSDTPLPEIGQTVIIWFINGDQEDGYYLPVITDGNPARVKKDSVKDESQEFPGNRSIIVTENDDLTIKSDRSINVEGTNSESILGDSSIGVNGNIDLRSEQVFVIEAGQSLMLKTDSGAFISLSASGIVLIQDAFGRSITLGGVGGSFGQWNFNGLPMRIINATSFQINGKEILTVGSTDSRGDTNNTKGW